jgi:hypothetical protein
MSTKMKAREIYEVVHDSGIIPCADLKQAESRVKNILKAEGFAYIVRKKLNKNNKIIQEWFVG